jgi:hypothetical protein
MLEALAREQLPEGAYPLGGAHETDPYDAAVFLDEIAHELLVELARDAGVPRPREPRSALWPTLRRMLRAELALAQPDCFGRRRRRQRRPSRSCA